MAKYDSKTILEYICEKMNVTKSIIIGHGYDSFSIPLIDFNDSDNHKYNIDLYCTLREAKDDKENTIEVAALDIYVSVYNTDYSYKYDEKLLYPIQKRYLDSYILKMKGIMYNIGHRKEMEKLYHSYLKKSGIKSIQKQFESEADIEDEYNLVVKNTGIIKNFLKDNKETIEYIINDDEANPEFSIVVKGLKQSLFDLDRLIRNPELYKKDRKSIKNLFDYIYREYEKIKRVVNIYNNNIEKKSKNIQKEDKERLYAYNEAYNDYREDIVKSNVVTLDRLYERENVAKSNCIVRYNREDLTHSCNDAINKLTSEIKSKINNRDFSYLKE